MASDKGYDAWTKLDKAADEFAKDALWVTRFQHMLLHYADPDLEEISRETMESQARALSEILSDLEGDLVQLRKRLEAYAKVERFSLTEGK